MAEPAAGAALRAPGLAPWLALLMAGCQAIAVEEPPPAPAPPLVRTTVVQSTRGGPLTLRGTVAAGARLRLGFEVPGVVAAVLAREGQRVRAGQLLARLEDIDAQLQVRLARAALAKARRDLDLAERLERRDAAPRRSREEAESQVETTAATLARAEEHLRHSRLLAPSGGTIFQRTAEPGEAVAAGLPVLIIDDTARLVVKVGVTEQELGRLRPGLRATLSLADGKPLPGRVLSIAPAPSPGLGLYMVQLAPRGRRRDLRPGALVEVRFAEERPRRALRIPLEALVHREDHDYVFVVRRAPTGVTVSLRPIERGDAVGQQLGVRSGLSDGERIVSEGAYFLLDGQPVRAAE